MEAKVDIQKLQVLCDRINQAADALAQVRMTVSGLTHTGPVPSYGYGINPMLGYSLPYQTVQPVTPWQPQSFTTPFLGAGLQHSVDPRLTPMYGTNLPFGYGMPIGIRHTGVQDVERNILEAQANDPYRLGQTFPFVFSGGRISPW